MVFNTIDCFNTGITQDIIYNQLDILRHRYSGNYDGVLGSIKNFDYTLMPNGSYECTTVLISIGDVIDTIRMNDTIGVSVGPADIAKSQDQNIDPESLNNIDYSEIKSQFELLMDEYCTLSDSNPRSNSQNITAIDSVIKDSDKPYIDNFIYKYKSGFSTTAANANLTTDQAARGGLQKSMTSWENPDRFNKSSNTNDGSLLGAGVSDVTKDEEQAVPVSQDNPGDKRSYYYIQFAYLLHILNVFKNVFASKDQTLVDIEIPANPLKSDSISNGLCQASYNSITIDPNVAVIRNSRANLFTDIEGSKAFRPEIFKTETKSVTGPVTADYNLREYLYENTNFGQIGNIYINIKEIVSIYKQEAVSNKGYVYLGRVISELLSRVAFSLGTINDFDKFVKDNKIVIIDKHYTELPADSLYSSKFKINVSGNNSIVRNHKIQSKIFPSQATMIAIAAQDRENVSAIQTSTYNYLNEGLKDRLFERTNNTKTDVDNKNISEIVAKRRKLSSILLLIQYVNKYVMVNKSLGVDYNSNIVAMNGYLNTLLVEMEGGTDYKAVVPISVDLTTDGFSGLTIGEIFTVDKKVLPKDYEAKHIGFIVTGISNEVVTNGWTTNLVSQMCILDQEDKQIKSKIKGEEVLKELLNEAESKKIENTTSIIYFNILAALVIDCLLNRYQIDTTSGAIKVRNISEPLYTKTAITEFSNGLVDFDYVLKDLNRAYLKAFPVAQYDENKKVSFRLDNLNSPIVLTKVLSELSLYFAMSTANQEVGITFNNEFYNKVGAIAKVKRENDPTTYEAWKAQFLELFRTDDKIVTTKEELEAVRLDTQSSRYKKITTFSKIDISRAIDLNTGLFNGPVASFFITGYPYYQ
jgi:hypothetical protein